MKPPKLHIQELGTQKTLCGRDRRRVPLERPGCAKSEMCQRCRMAPFRSGVNWDDPRLAWQVDELRR